MHTTGIVLFALLAAVGYWVLQHAASNKEAEVYVKRTGQAVGWALLAISLLGVAFCAAGACCRGRGPEMGRPGMMGQAGPGGMPDMQQPGMQPGMQQGGQPQGGMPGGDRQDRMVRGDRDGQDENGPKEGKDLKGARPEAQAPKKQTGQRTVFPLRPFGRGGFYFSFICCWGRGWVLL